MKMELTKQIMIKEEVRQSVDNKVEIGLIVQLMNPLLNHHHHQVRIIHFLVMIFK
jgi:hypothetical protein